MAEISGLGESSTIDRYDATVETESKKVEAAQQETQPQALPGESEKKLKASEDMHRALAPNLRNLDREQEIQIQLTTALFPQTRFSLFSELLKIKLKEFEKQGGSVSELAQEMHVFIEKKTPLTEAFTEELKQGICKIYAGLVDTAFLGHKLSETIPYQSFFLQLFELEKETGFEVSGKMLLMQECIVLKNICLKKANGIILHVDLLGVRKFYSETVFPTMLKILPYMEKGGEQEDLQMSLKFIISMMHIDLLADKELPTIDQSIDPLIHFLPYIVKYSSLEKIEEYFNIRYKDLSEIDKAYLWIDLNCQAAEILASIDPNKSHEYLEKAQKEKDSKLWAYPFSTKRSTILAKANEAAARIEAAHLKCKESDALKAS